MGLHLDCGLDRGLPPDGDGRQMSCTGPDGDSTMRLIEAGHALHRAAIALEGMGPGTLSQAWTGRYAVPDCTKPTRGEGGSEPVSALDEISKAIAYVDSMIASMTDAAVESEQGAPLGTSEEAGHAPGDEIDLITAAVPHSPSAVIEAIADELNRSVIRGVFEAALILQGALQFDCEPAATRRIQTAIALLDDTIREVRTAVFRFSESGGQPWRVGPVT
ncbi:MAG: hypothetical protein ACLQPH_20790 [Acidimicrobiales bacterium]